MSSLPSNMKRLAFNHGLWEPTRKHLFDVFRCISVEDQTESLKYAYKRDVKSFLAARLLTLFAAKQCLGLNSDQVIVQRDENGRPHFKNSYDFDFNLTHNGDFTLLTACRNMRTGVDVMRIELPPACVSAENFILKMKSLFSSSEFNWLHSCSNEISKMRNFFRLWCLKESFVKNTGTGLRIDVSTIEFDLSTDQPICRCPGFVPEEWAFEEHHLPFNHVAAITWRKPGSKIDPISKEPFEELSFEQIMSCLKPWNDVKEDIWSVYTSKEQYPPTARRILS